MATGGFQQTVLDVAFDKIGKKYPSFKRETGRKMIDSLSDAYKSFKNRRQGKQSDNAQTTQVTEAAAATSEEEMKLLGKEATKEEVKSEIREEGNASESKELVPWKKPQDDSDECDYLTADEDESPPKTDGNKDKLPDDPKDPEKGPGPPIGESAVDCGPAGVGPAHKPKGAIAGTVTSIVCVAGVIYGGLNKKPSPTLSMSTEGCLHNFTSPLTPSNFEEPDDRDDLPLIFRISFMYYATIGIAIVYLVGVPVSLLTGGNKITDQRLLAPFLRRKNQEVPGTIIPERIDLLPDTAI